MKGHSIRTVIKTGKREKYSVLIQQRFLSRCRFHKFFRKTALHEIVLSTRQEHSAQIVV
jgi:hypothetical protein